MADQTILCPNCKYEIKLNEAISAPIVDRLRRQFEADARKQSEDLARRERAIAERAAETLATEMADLRRQLEERCSLGSQEPFCRFHSQPPGQVSVAFMDDGLGFAGGECRGLGGHQVEDPASVLQLVPLMEFRVV